ncbi:MAG TPA: prolipoprotein diacylglyceryl transferase [Chryseolinea sp.]|nr:prolipoprotein diacylglyceryl transferase [Chryseolinea sp.]
MLNYIIWNVNPSVFAFSDVPRWYGVLWALALFLSYTVVTYIYKHEGRRVSEVDDITLYLVAGTFLGARLGHVFFYDPQYFWEHPSEILLPFRLQPEFEFIGFAGLASHGSAIGILLAIWIYSRMKKKSYLFVADRIVIGASLAGGLIRLGNLMNSEMVGKPTDVPWAFIFKQVDLIPRHPAQLYEALFCFALFVGLFLTWKKYYIVLPEGLLTGIFFFALFVQRFINEFFKLSQVDFEDGWMINMGQILSLPFIVLGAYLIMRAYKIFTARLR